MASIELALEELRSLGPGEKINIAKIAQKFGVDRSNLSRRFRGIRGLKEAQYKNKQLLNNQQLKELIKWINQLTAYGLLSTTSMLCNFAKEISGKEPGRNWSTHWVKAYSDQLISRFSTGIDIDRKRADSAYKYALYFELLGQKIKKYNLLPNQIYNMDEKGFIIRITSKFKRIFSQQ